MKKIVLLILVLLMTGSVTSCHKKDPASKLTMSGSYYDNIAEFKNTEGDAGQNNEKENISGMAKSFLQSVTYDIKELDEDNMTATLDVTVPDMAQLLPQIISDTIEENDDTSYEELLQTVQSELEARLNKGNIEKTTTTIELPVEKEGDEYKLIYNEDWEQAVYGNLEKMYLDCYQAMLGGLTDEMPE